MNSPIEAKHCTHIGTVILNQSIPGETDGGADGWKIGWAKKKERRKEYSEELHPSFVRCKPIRFYDLHDCLDSDWPTFKANNFISMTAPLGCLRNFQYMLWSRQQKTNQAMGSISVLQCSCNVVYSYYICSLWLWINWNIDFVWILAS